METEKKSSFKSLRIDSWLFTTSLWCSIDDYFEIFLKRLIAAVCFTHVAQRQKQEQTLFAKRFSVSGRKHNLLSELTQWHDDFIWFDKRAGLLLISDDFQNTRLFWIFLKLDKTRALKALVRSNYLWIHYCFEEKIMTKISVVFFQIKKSSTLIYLVFSVLEIINEFLNA